jgi:hypothetical protein
MIKFTVHGNMCRDCHNALTNPQVFTPTPPDQITMSQLREMRDRAYGKPTTDKNWEACRDRWNTEENILWLQEQNPMEAA